MTIRNIFKLGLLICFGVACESPDNEFRDEFRWITGKWIGSNDNLMVIEHWMWNKHRFEGVGYHIKEGDTVFSEHLFLSQYHGRIGFSAVFDGAGPFTFSLVDTSKNDFRFTNEEHDFPAIINYRIDSDTSLTITLQGQGEPKGPEVSYQMIRTRK